METETQHILGKSKILQSQIDEEVLEIIKYLKSKKQTYAVNKFVLEEVIEELKEVII